MKPFIDANIIVKAFTENKEKERCRKVVHEGFVTTALALVEAQHAIGIIKEDRFFAAQCIKSLFRSNALIVSLDRNLLFETTKKIEKYGLALFDLIHYTAAMLSGCNMFISYDAHFDGLEIKRIEP